MTWRAHLNCIRKYHRSTTKGSLIYWPDEKEGSNTFWPESICQVLSKNITCKIWIIESNRGWTKWSLSFINVNTSLYKPWTLFMDLTKRELSSCKKPLYLLPWVAWVGSGLQKIVKVMDADTRVFSCNWKSVLHLLVAFHTQWCHAHKKKSPTWKGTDKLQDLHSLCCTLGCFSADGDELSVSTLTQYLSLHDNIQSLKSSEQRNLPDINWTWDSGLFGFLPSYIALDDF